MTMKSRMSRGWRKWIENKLRQDLSNCLSIDFSSLLLNSNWNFAIIFPKSLPVNRPITIYYFRYFMGLVGNGKAGPREQRSFSLYNISEDGLNERMRQVFDDGSNSTLGVGFFLGSWKDSLLKFLGHNSYCPTPLGHL